MKRIEVLDKGWVQQAGIELMQWTHEGAD